MVKLFEGARKDWRYVAKISLAAIAFWVLQFAYQFFFLVPGEIAGALVRSFALAGATMISFALIIGPLSKIVPKYNFVPHRRAVGVWGFSFILMHISSVVNFYFLGDVTGLYYDLNPYVNPIIFGIMAAALFVPMYLTSTDWAVEKLGFKKWKMVHRMVYLAYIFSVLHYTQINPALLENLAGYLLIAATVAAFGLELAAFAKSALQNPKRIGVGIGIAIILLAAVLFYFAYSPEGKKFATTADFSKIGKQEIVMEQNLPIEQAVEEMKKFMEEKGGDPFVGTEPVPEDREFSESIIRGGRFENLNYMTSGTLTVQELEGKFFIVFNEDFETPNGPNLVVYLTKNSSPSTREDVMQGIELGELKSIKGKQVYEVPAGIDAREFGSVTIHCKAFNVPWSYAKLG